MWDGKWEPAMSLKAIVAKRGGDIYDGGRRANIPAPGHSAADRSVSLVLLNGRVLVHTFNGVDWRDVLDDLRACGLIDAANRPKSLSGAPVPRPAAQMSVDRRGKATELWDRAGRLERSLSAQYLRRRGIRGPLPASEVIRHHHRCPVSVYAPRSSTQPALIARIRDPVGAPAAVELTYLDSNGRRAVGLRLPRKTVGVLPPGSAVRLTAAAEEMLVAEGLVTTLSAMERFGLPGWALLSTTNLRSWMAPAGVRSILIAADRGEDGERSAHVLQDRLRAGGLWARIELPPKPWGDWNEAMLGLGRS